VSLPKIKSKKVIKLSKIKNKGSMSVKNNNTNSEMKEFLKITSAIISLQENYKASNEGELKKKI